MNDHFFDREVELETLSRCWESDRAELLILHGPRRVGKTTLLKEWARRTGVRVLHWEVPQVSPAEQLHSFCQALRDYSAAGKPTLEGCACASWEEAFEMVGRLAQEERLALFIDKYPYLAQATPGMASKFQKLWDLHSDELDLFLCLAGSNLDVMFRDIFSYHHAPLYMRARSQIQLRPFVFNTTRSFFPHYSAIERVTLYSVFGGIPAYWARLDPARSVTDNLRDLLFSPAGPLLSEPRRLLQDYSAEPAIPLAILKAITRGKNTAKKIAAFPELKGVDVPAQLDLLTRARIIEAERPVIDTSLRSRRSRYCINDPFLRFHATFLAGREEEIASGQGDQVFEEVEEQMPKFIASNVWPDLCRQWVLWACARGKLPHEVFEIGSAWKSKDEGPIVGLNRAEKTLFLGECLWGSVENGRRVMEELVQVKTCRYVPKFHRWKVSYLGFSREAWPAEALEYQDEINRHPVHGKNWESTGMQLLALEELDKDMYNWFQEVYDREDDLSDEEILF
ncbi:MAG: hypothetical protein JXB85_00990 [Anaerolineales bacterium]|nr:hypothetical protein [Anaerolineales bacterium]